MVGGGCQGEGTLSRQGREEGRKRRELGGGQCYAQKAVEM